MRKIPSFSNLQARARVLLLALVSAFACTGPSVVAIGAGSGCNKPLPVPVNDVIDCAKAEGMTDWSAFVTKLTPDLGDWTKLVSDVIALAPTAGFHIVECVAEDLINQYLSVKHDNVASTNSAAQAREDIRVYVQNSLTKARANSGEAAPARKVVFHFEKACPGTPGGCAL